MLLKLSNVIYSKLDRFDNLIFNLTKENWDKLQENFPGEGTMCFSQFEYKGRVLMNIKVPKSRVYCDVTHLKAGTHLDAYMTLFEWERDGKNGVSACLDDFEVVQTARQKKSRTDYV